MPRFLLVALLTLALSACASSALITGTPRAPIDPSQVRFYYSPPQVPFEEIALLESKSGAFTFGAQNKTDAVVANLREEAAKLGANGVLFRGTSEGYGGSGVSVGAGGGRIGGSSFSSAGVGISLSPTQKYGSGIAIYVPDPPPDGEPAPTVEP